MFKATTTCLYKHEFKEHIYFLRKKTMGIGEYQINNKHKAGEKIQRSDRKKRKATKHKTEKVTTTLPKQSLNTKTNYTPTIKIMFHEK